MADGEEETQRFIRFCYNSTSDIVWEYRGQFPMTGSRAELCYDSPTDADAMLIHPDYVALPFGCRLLDSKRTSRTKEPAILLICRTEDVHNGYTHLLRADTGQFCSKEIFARYSKIFDGLPEANPAFTIDYDETTSHQINNEFLTHIMLRGKLENSLTGPNYTGHDFVPAIQCLVWPKEAAEWVTRKRYSGWPTSSLVKQCTRNGCYFVRKAHHTSIDPDIEFRFSFSNAELELIRRWLLTQKQIYLILKRIKTVANKNLAADGNNAKTFLSSYHFKTLMFWSVELKPLSFWDVGNIVESTKQLMCEVIEQVIDRRCPNYFIPSNNMFDHITDREILRRTVEELSHLTDCVEDFVLTFNSDYYVSGIDIYYPHCYLHSYVALMYGSNIQTRICYYLLGLYRGLDALLTLVSGSTAETRNSEADEFKNIERQLLKLLDKETEYNPIPVEGVCDIYPYCFFNIPIWDASFERRLHLSYRRYFADVHTSSAPLSDKSVRIKDDQFQFSSNDERQQQIGHSESIINDVKVVVERAYWKTTLGPTAKQHHSASWYCTTAHLANLYHTVYHEYHAAIAQCNKVVNSLAEANKYGKLEMTKFSFYMHLSSEWSALFDSDIQSALGIVLLYDALRNQINNTPSDDILVVPVCPIMFSHYIKVRSIQKLIQMSGAETEDDHGMRSAIHDMCCYSNETSSRKRVCQTFLGDCLLLLILRVTIDKIRCTKIGKS